jgi:hypothetical protein
MDWIKKQFTGQNVLIVLVLGLYLQSYISNYNLNQELMYTQAAAKGSAKDVTVILEKLERVELKLDRLLKD